LKASIEAFGGQNRSFKIPTGDFSQNPSFLGPRKHRFRQKRGSRIHAFDPSKSLNSALAERRQWLMKLLQHRLRVSLKVPTDMGIFMKYSYMVLQM
jgi:hypothetical protein